MEVSASWMIIRKIYLKTYWFWYLSSSQLRIFSSVSFSFLLEWVSRGGAVVPSPGDAGEKIGCCHSDWVTLCVLVLTSYSVPESLTQEGMAPPAERSSCTFLWRRTVIEALNLRPGLFWVPLYGDNVLQCEGLHFGFTLPLVLQRR